MIREQIDESIQKMVACCAKPKQIALTLDTAEKLIEEYTGLQCMISAKPSDIKFVISEKLTGFGKEMESREKQRGKPAKADVELLKCTCGKRPEKLFVYRKGNFYRCPVCEKASWIGANEKEARLLWNEMIEREAKA